VWPWVSTKDDSQRLRASQALRPGPTVGVWPWVPSFCLSQPSFSSGPSPPPREGVGSAPPLPGSERSWIQPLQWSGLSSRREDPKDATGQRKRVVPGRACQQGSRTQADFVPSLVFLNPVVPQSGGPGSQRHHGGPRGVQPTARPRPREVVCSPGSLLTTTDVATIARPESGPPGPSGEVGGSNGKGRDGEPMADGSMEFMANGD